MIVSLCIYKKKENPNKKTRILITVNEQNADVQFTKEIEQKGKLPFLDCLVSRDNNELRRIRTDYLTNHPTTRLHTKPQQQPQQPKQQPQQPTNNNQPTTTNQH